MVAQGVKGIAITPIDPSVSKALDKAIAKGVKIVLMDNDIPGWQGRSALATTDNLEAGKIADAHLKTLLKDGDKIGILDGKPDVAPLNDRVQGMLQGLGGLKVDIVGRGRTACEPDKGQQMPKTSDGPSGCQSDLFSVRPARRDRRDGDQERQARSQGDPGRVRLLLWRGRRNRQG